MPAAVEVPDSAPKLWSDQNGEGEPVVFVHGFTQTGRSWIPVIASLAEHYRVCLVDLPGHGHSELIHASDLAEAARLVAEVGGRATYVGYSMGARLCLQLALDLPELVERLVVIGATPGITDAALREQRRLADDDLADRLDPPGGGQGLDVATFLDEWLGMPMFADLSGEKANRAARSNDRRGLAEALRHLGTGDQAPMQDELARLSMPMLVMAGANDVAFVGHAKEICRRVGDNARLVTIDDALHAAPFVRPDVFRAALEAFLESTTP